jgi:hypothetical protein
MAASRESHHPDRADVLAALAGHRIVNPLTAPVTMDGEGGGPKSPFFPSSAKTNVGGIIPSNFFMDSKTCGECHDEIAAQVQQSVHGKAVAAESVPGALIDSIHFVENAQAMHYAASLGPVVPLKPAEIKGFADDFNRARHIDKLWDYYVGLGRASGTACVAMIDYQIDASFSNPPSNPRFTVGVDDVDREGSSRLRVKLSNCSAMSELPVSASGTPELSAAETVL